jgi:hypothetical protein
MGVSQQPRDQSLIAHIEAVSSRDDRATARLLASLAGGTGDCSNPTALDWVRRWGPARAVFSPPACSCRAGRCRVCN